MLGRVRRAASCGLARHRAALSAVEIEADYPACFDRRLLRRLGSFILISCAIVSLSAWHTNQLSYRWWTAAMDRNGAGEVTSYQYAPVLLRAEARLEVCQFLCSSRN